MPKDITQHDELIEELRRLWFAEPRMSNDAIGTALGRSNAWVWLTAKQLGLPKRPVAGSKIDREKFIELAKAGTSRADIAAHFGVSPGSVTKAAKRFGVTLGARFVTSRAAVDRLTREVVEQEWNDRSRSLRQIAKDNGVCVDTLQRVAKGYGLPSRKAVPKQKAEPPVRATPGPRRPRRRLTAIPPADYVPPQERQQPEPDVVASRWTPEMDDAIRATGGKYREIDRIAEMTGVDRKAIQCRWLKIRGGHPGGRV